LPAAPTIPKVAVMVMAAEITMVMMAVVSD
jgi:hypothetical protein